MRYGITHRYADLESDAQYVSYDDNGDEGYSYAEAMRTVFTDVDTLYGELTITGGGDLADSHTIHVTVTSDVYRHTYAIYPLWI